MPPPKGVSMPPVSTVLERNNRSRRFLLSQELHPPRTENIKTSLVCDLFLGHGAESRGVSCGLLIDKVHSGGAGWGTQQVGAGSLEDTNWVCGRHTGKLAERDLRRFPSGVPRTLPAR